MVLSLTTWIDNGNEGVEQDSLGQKHDFLDLTLIFPQQISYTPPNHSTPNILRFRKNQPTIELHLYSPSNGYDIQLLRYISKTQPRKQGIDRGALGVPNNSEE